MMMFDRGRMLQACDVTPVNVPIHLPVVFMTAARAATGDGLLVPAALACNGDDALECAQQSAAQLTAGGCERCLAVPSDRTPTPYPARGRMSGSVQRARWW